MSTVTVSPKFQVVIPRELREALEIKPGQKMAMFNVNGTIRLVPVRPMNQMRGFLRGISTDGLREKRDRNL
jgi:AbrB family looped-hinge helix DNA binding protein